MKSASLPDGFFLGQIPPNWNEYVRTLSWEDAHNNRVKVRIPGKHSKGNEICDKDLPWAIVEQSTSSGNLNGSSVGLWGGEWVTGYFLDKDEQLPVITGVLGDNIIQGNKIKKSACSTEFKPVGRFNSGIVAQAHQVTGGQPPKGSASIDEKTKEAATKGMGKDSKSDAELEAEAAEGQTEDLFDNQNPEEAAEPPATIPVASDIPQQIPPPPTYAPLPVGAQVEGNTGPFGRVLTEPQSRFPGGPQYQLISDGNEGSGTKIRWIDKPRDPKFDEARAAAGKPPISNKTEPGGNLW